MDNIDTIDSISKNGYEEFTHIYNQTRINFKKFIQEI